MKTFTINLDSQEYYLGLHDGRLTAIREMRRRDPYYEPVPAYDDDNYKFGFRAGRRQIQEKAESDQEKDKWGRRSVRWKRLENKKKKEKNAPPETAAYKLGHRNGSRAETYAQRMEPYERPRLRNREGLAKIMPAHIFARMTAADFLNDNDYWLGWWDGVDARHHRWELEKRVASGYTHTFNAGQKQLGHRIGTHGYAETRAALDQRMAMAADENAAAEK